MKRFCLLLLILISLHSFAQEDPEVELFEFYIPVPTTCGWQFLNPETRILDTVCYEDFYWRNSAEYGYVIKKNGLWGSSGGPGMQLIDFVYDSLVFIHNGAYLVKEEGSWYMLDYRGNSRPLDIDSFFISKDMVHVYREGKSGLIDEDGRVYHALYDGIQPFNLRRAGILDMKYTALCLVSDQGYLNLVDSVGTKLLPAHVVDIQEDDFGFIRYYNGSWNYLNLATHTLIDSKDRDLIPYAENVYKIYNADRSRGILHYEEKVFGSEEDYFYLNPEFIAVRSGDKIGLQSAAGNWILRPKYDRVEWMTGEKNTALFRFYIGDSCGMVDAAGVEHIAAHYANILPTGDKDRFIVFNQKLCGMVNKKGLSILPITFEYLELWDEFVQTQKDNHFGICTREGKEILPPRYKNMLREYLQIDMVRVPVFFAQKYNDKWQIANKNGVLSNEEYSHFQFGGTAVKGYANGEISLYAFNESGEVEMEEHFSGLPILKTGVNEDLRTKFSKSWNFSYLEENQKNGLYGLRFYTKQGLAVNPKYTRARMDRFNNFLCPLPNNSSEPLADSVAMKASQHFITLYPSNGTEGASNLIFSTAYLKGGFWSYEALGTNSIGNDNFLSAAEESPFKIGGAGNSVWKYMVNEEQVLKYYKGNARICPIEEADMSLYAYYLYRNALDHFRLTANDWGIVMNPQLGVRFDGGEIRGSQYDNLKHIRTIAMRPHIAFSELQEWKDQELIYMKKLNSAYGVLQELNWEEGEKPRKIEKIKALKHHDIGYMNFFELEMDSLFLRKVHPDYPNFEFEADSVNLGYYHGRIVGLSPYGGYELRAPNDSVYAEAAAIRYVGNAWFALLDNGSWSLVDRNGEEIYPGKYKEIGNWNGKELMLSTVENTDFINASGKLIRRQAAKTTPINNWLLRVDQTNGAVALNVLSGREFPIASDDKFLPNGWILRSSEKGRFTLLSTFTGLQQEISSDKKPEALGFSVVSKNKTTLMITDTNLRVIRLKKIEDYDLFDKGLLVVRNKKGKRLFNEEGTLLLDYSKASFSQDGALVLVSQKDTSYFMDRSGQKYTYQEGKNMNRMAQGVRPEENSSDFTCVQEGAYWGLKHEDQWVLPPKYGHLQKASDGNFQATYTHTRGLVDTKFDTLYTGFFDSLYDLGGAYILIQSGDLYTVIDREGTVVYTVQLKKP